MSTFLSDLQKTNPALAADYALVGNQDETSLRNMIRALSLPISAFMNTQKEENRLAAAKRILAARRKSKR
jgi:hypothetical protein